MIAVKAKTKRKAKGNPRGPSSQASKENRIEDVSEKSLVFASSAKGLSTQVAGAVEDGHLEETMHGATNLTLEMLDREYQSMQSGLYGSRVQVAIDGAPFRLTEVSVVDDEKLAVKFEHALVAEMREYTSPKKAQRGNVNRAEFILLMLSELKLPHRFVCPELHRKQPTPAPEQTKETVVVKTGKDGKKTVTRKKAKKTKTVTNLAEVGKGPSVSPVVQKSPTKALTCKGVPLTHEQSAIVEQALTAAAAVSASPLAMTALVVALIQENSISDHDPGDPGDRGPLSLTDETAHSIQKKTGHGTINPYDITEVSEHFITAGFTSRGAGGANALARANPHDNATHIATLVQGPKVEYPHSWEAEAREIVAAFLGAGLGGRPVESAPGFGGGGASEPQTETVVKTATVEFTRGTPGQIESTFECALRLAEEVGWSFFVSGRDEIYFVNDDDLLKAPPRFVLKPDSPGFVKITFDVEVGARTIIVKGKRQPKPSEATLIVRADRWAAPPGCVIRLEGWGPADHPWLVDEVQRSLYDAEVTIKLRAPQHPLEEPKATASGTGTPGKEIVGGQGVPESFAVGTQPGSSNAVVEAAKQALSEKRKYVYSEASNRENRGTLFGPSPRTMDCSAFVTLCYKAAGMPDPNHKGYNGIGTTYTMIPHCRQVSNPRPGDLCFFGPRDAPSHVNLYIGGGQSINMGGPGEPAQGPATQMGPPGFIGYFRPM